MPASSVLRLALVAAAFTSVAAIVPARAGSATSSRFALVELFTSEGCSSCPPADALLSRLAADAARTGEPVVALSFHVTYWDHLGWRDRFSDEAYTQRQGAYARRFSLESLYTPQMVVDGQHEFVGSNAAAAERAVNEALARPRATEVVLEARPEDGGVTATYRVAHAPAGSVLWVAWADADAASAPNRGENQGRQLHHVNVVRALERVPIRGGANGGSVRLERPAAVPGSVVAWVQRGDAGEVLAGAKLAVGAR